MNIGKRNSILLFSSNSLKVSVLFDKNYEKFLPVTCILLSACLCAYPPCMGVFH